MNASDTLDYALGRLDGPTRDEADREIAGDPALAERLDRLGLALHRLLDDGEDAIEPPADLARRTLTLVADVRRRRRTLLDYVPVTVPFRWTDVAVAAAVLLAGVLTLVPALRCSKQRMDQAGCGFNLQQLGISLAQYAAQHHAYPYATARHPDAVAGTFAIQLHDAGLLPDPSVLDCPYNGTCHHARRLPSFDDACEILHKSPDRLRHLIGCDYAYHVGYRDKSGRPGPLPDRLSAIIPLLADQPPHEGYRILEGNSPNHGFHGQNVLHSDGHVSWHNTRRLGPHDPDMYLNADREPAPGADIHDAVLVPSHFPFVVR